MDRDIFIYLVSRYAVLISIIIPQEKECRILCVCLASKIVIAATKVGRNRNKRTTRLLKCNYTYIVIACDFY